MPLRPTLALTRQIVYSCHVSRVSTPPPLPQRLIFLTLGNLRGTRSATV